MDDFDDPAIRKEFYRYMEARFAAEPGLLEEWKARQDQLMQEIQEANWGCNSNPLEDGSEVQRYDGHD
jgi:hypothetical protein